MVERVVHHEKYGRGVVKAARHKGFQLHVAFDNGRTRWVRLDEFVDSQPVQDSQDIASDILTTSQTRLAPNRFKARRMIEAFRLGIVPYDCVRDFIYGRSAEIEVFVDWLQGPDQNALLTVGEYGTGKTHFLHYAYGQALQEGFAVALVEMDANETPFHRPKRVYSSLVRTLRFPCQSQFLGFRDFISEALASSAFEDHSYFGCLIGKTSDETLWDWIEARDFHLRPPNLYQKAKINTRRDFDAVERNLMQMEAVLKEVQRLTDGSDARLSGSYLRLPGLYPYFKAANIYCYLLSALGWAAEEILGLKGLLLIFDEAETVDTYDNVYQADKSQNFLKALIHTANNDNRLIGSPRDSGLDYCRVGIGPSVPFLYKPLSGLKLLFGLTPIDADDELVRFEQAMRIDLSPLTIQAKRELFEHILNLYRVAYDDFETNLSADRVAQLFQQVMMQSALTRLFVKGSIEVLDLIRHGA